MLDTEIKNDIVFKVHTEPHLVTEVELVLLILHGKQTYYSGNEEFTDHFYDGLEILLKKINPDHPVLGMVGWSEEAEKAILEQL